MFLSCYGCAELVRADTAHVGDVDGLQFAFCDAGCHGRLLADPNRDTWCVDGECDEDRVPGTLRCVAHQDGSPTPDTSSPTPSPSGICEDATAALGERPATWAGAGPRAVAAGA